MLVADHPAYSPQKCYARVDRNLRALLKRRQLPLVSLYTYSFVKRNDKAINAGLYDSRKEAKLAVCFTQPM